MPSGNAEAHVNADGGEDIPEVVQSVREQGDAPG
jgi:hypothetical protein